MARRSPDGKSEAFIQNFNLYIRPVGGRLEDAAPLSWDGSEGNYYTLQSRWRAGRLMASRKRSSKTSTSTSGRSADDSRMLHRSVGMDRKATTTPCNLDGAPVA